MLESYSIEEKSLSPDLLLHSLATKRNIIYTCTYMRIVCIPLALCQRFMIMLLLLGKNVRK